jgi:hypothetical protein
MSRTTIPAASSAVPKAEHVSTACGLGKSLLIRVQDLAGQQEELRQIREQVLVNRENLSSASKRVRHQRETLGLAEAKLMDAFRERHNSVANSDSSDPNIAYAAVEDARNKLVDLEDDLLHIQDALGAAEWELMDMETDLYQYDLQQLAGGDMGQDTLDATKKKTPDPLPPSVSIRPSISVAPSSTSPPCTRTLVPTTIPFPTTTTHSFTKIPSPTVIDPSIRVQYQVVVTHHEQLLRRFDELRTSYNDMGQQLASVAGIATDITESSGILIWNIIESEIKARSLKAKLVLEEGPIISQCYTKSDTGSIPEADIHLSATKRSAISDSAIRHVSDHVPDKHFVGTWLLDCLRNSGMEKACFKSILDNELHIPNVTTLDINRLEGYIQLIWPSNMVNLLNWPGQESSVSGCIRLVQTNLDDESDTASLCEKNGLDLPVTYQRAEPSIDFAKTERDRQWFISLPRSELIPLKFYDAEIVECMAAWVEGNDFEIIPARVELPEFEQSASHNDMRNHHLYAGDMSRLSLVTQPSTLAIFPQNSSTSAEQRANCGILVANLGNTGIELSELEYTCVDGNPLPEPHSLVGPLEEGLATTYDNNLSTSDRKDRQDQKVCVNHGEYSRTQLVRTPLLRMSSPPYRYEQKSPSFVRILLCEIEAYPTFVRRNENTSDSVKRSVQLFRVKAYASYGPENNHIGHSFDRTESRTSLATTYSRASLAELFSSHRYLEDLAHLSGSVKRPEQACSFHLPAADHHANGLQTMTIYNPGDLDTAGTVCSHSLVI